MTAIEIRPRFQRIVGMSKAEVLERLQWAVKEPGAPVWGLIVDHHVTLTLPPEKRHYWSPQLSLEVEEHEEGALIRGLFGPSPSIWLMFVFFYSLLGFIAMIVMIMGFSQLNLGLSGGILWLLPALGFIVLMMYLSASAGQRLGSDQMHELQRFFEETVE
jgi:hypothetical protein